VIGVGSIGDSSLIGVGAIGAPGDWAPADTIDGAGEVLGALPAVLGLVSVAPDFLIAQRLTSL
jgi:hypothetical protein